MSNLQIIRHAASGSVVYALISDLAGLTFDQHDNTVKALASATNAPILLTEGGAVGSGNKCYAATLDLSRINATLEAKTYTVSVFIKGGSSFNFTTDVRQGVATPIVVQFSQLGTRKVEPHTALEMVTTSGNSLRAVVSLLVDGISCDIKTLAPSATCQSVIKLEGTTNHLTMSTSDYGSATNAHRFVCSKTNPNFSAEAIYEVVTTITENSRTWSKLETISIQA
jgi:hypothetical protein